MTRQKIKPSRSQSVDPDIKFDAHRDSETPEIRHAEQDEERKLRQEDHKTRRWLINTLTGISIAWLLFTAVIVVLVGLKWWISLSDSVMIAFLTTSMGNVLGLWGIGLGYYFGKTGRRH